MRSKEIDVSGYDMVATLEKERRRRTEAELARDQAPLAAMLLSLAVAVARLSARCGREATV